MLAELESLLVVQNRDKEILKLQSDLEKIPKDAKAAKAKLDGDRQAMEDAKQAIQSKEIERKNLQLDRKTRQDTILKLKTQQFETKKNDEYNALGNEVVRYTKDVDALETQELELMEQIEQLRDQLKELEAAFEKKRASVQEDLNKMKARKGECETRLAEVQAERAQLTQGVDGTALALYERLLKSKGATVITPVNHGKCEGCHMKVVPSTIVKVQKEEEIAHCESCGRMLYLGEGH